jgi:hypothetical protein
MPVSVDQIKASLQVQKEADHFRKALNQQYTQLLQPVMDFVNAKFTQGSYGEVALCSLLGNLRHFSNRLFEGLVDEQLLNVKAIIPREYSVQYASNLVARQVEMDVATISNIAYQRQNSSALLPKLEFLDQKAHAMIQRAVNSGLFSQDPAYVPETTPTQNRTHIEPRPLPLVYFGANATNRTIPYTPVTPLSLPIDLINKDPNTPNDFAIWFEPALAYEVGRLVFWKGNHPDSDSVFGGIKFARFVNLRMQEGGCSEWISNAAAGIFADVFATLVCNTAAAGFSIRRSSIRRGEHFIAEDSRYQLPLVLRPLVVIETLKKMGVDSVVISDLQKIWDAEQLDAYGTDITTPSKTIKPKSVAVYSKGTSLNLGMEAAENEVKDAVNFIYSLLQNVQTQPTLIPSLQFPSPSEWMNGDLWNAHRKYWADPNSQSSPAQGQNYFFESWHAPLSLETDQEVKRAYESGVIPESSYKAHYEGQKIYWAVTTYAAGWTMESVGNSGTPY